MTENQGRVSSILASGTINQVKGVFKMDLEKMLLENRINLLLNRDPVGNARIINKLRRRLRKM